MKTNKIVIVGAGPVGMVAALSLARAGIPVTLLEQRACLSGVGSRAIVLDKGSLIHLNDIGCVDGILKNGLVASGRRTFFRGREILKSDFPKPRDNNLPLFVNIPQPDTERILLDQVQATPNITLSWEHAVVGVSQTESHVSLAVQSPRQIKNIACQYVLACDGCRSPIRKFCDLDFPGETNPYRFLIVDVRARLNRCHEHHFHFDPPHHREHAMLIVPQPCNVWRFDFQMPLGAEPEQCHDALRQRIARVIGDQPFEMVWSSTYQFHQRLMRSMSHGRIHFLGDAAHLVNPFGGRGLNAGIQDARCIAGKLIRVHRQLVQESILNTYATERGAANQEHQRITRKTMDFIAPQSRVRWMWRNLILAGSARIPSFRRLVNSGRMSAVSPKTHVMQFP